MSTKTNLKEMTHAVNLEARMRGGSLFCDQLEALFAAVHSGRHVDDADKVMQGLSAICVSFAQAATELQGLEREGFLMAWNWWSAVTVEGDVMYPNTLRANLEGGVQ